MSTTTATKTAAVAVLSHQSVVHPNTVKGSAQDVSSKLAAKIVMYHSSVEATANTNPGSFLVQVSPSSSGDEDWATVAAYTARVSTADTEAMTATEPATETVMAVASTTGFVVGDQLYIQNSTLADSEWAMCTEVASNTSITLLDGLTNQQTSSSVIWNDADIFVHFLDTSAVVRVRVIFQHVGTTGANCHVKALMVTLDSLSTA